MTYVAAVSRPLLERIATPGVRADLAQTAASVAREVSRILSTRCYADADSELNILNFGIPNVSDVSAQNPEAVQNLLQAIRLAIECYEPRLSQVEVFAEAAAVPYEMSVRVRGILCMAQHREAFEFRAALSL